MLWLNFANTMQKNLSELFGVNPELEQKFVTLFIKALEKKQKNM